MPTKKPTKLEKLGSLTKASISFIKSGLKKSPNEIYDSRVLTCLSCTEYDIKDDSCCKCGCYINIKASWLSEECPLDKWTI